MKVTIPYGKKLLRVDIPVKNLIGILSAKHGTGIREKKTLDLAIHQPKYSRIFADFLQDAHKILIIVNDHNRPTPTAKVLDAIYNNIEKKNLKFLIATGVHTPPNERELRNIFGVHYARFKEKITIHDSKKDRDMAFLGKTRKGTELWFNKLVLQADKIISISSVEPHYFAGFTGGRKSFLPGVAGFRTIEQNHGYVLAKNARALRLQSNPIHEDMVDAIKKIGAEKVFTIQLVLDRQQRIQKAFAGNIHDAFEKATRYAKKFFGVRILSEADIVVTVARPPFDHDLYQTLKAIENGKLALKKNGVLIVVSPCQNGLGPANFSRLFKNSRGLYAALRHARCGYRLGDHNAVNLYELTHWAKVWAVSEIETEKLKNAYITKFATLQDAIDRALEEKNNKAMVLVLMDGSLTVPIFEKS